MLETIAGRSRSAPGRELTLRIAPHRTLLGARAAQDLYRDLLGYADTGDPPPPAAPPDLRPELERLRLAGATLRGEELWRVGALLVQVRAIVTWYKRTAREAPGLAPLVESLDPLDALQREIARALEPTGEVRDEASPALARIRRSIRGLRDRLASRMESILRSLATPESLVCQIAVNYLRGSELRKRASRAIAAVSDVNRLGPKEMSLKPASWRSWSSASVKPPGGPTASTASA